jgi:hypothetical protein
MQSLLRLAVARGGRVAVQIAHGCDRRCWFCVEPSFLGKQVVARPVDEVVREIDLLARAGVRRFWLTTSELNVGRPEHAIEVLRALAGRGLDLQVFVQPAPMPDDLLDALEDAGVDPSGLSFELGHLDDRVLRAGGGPANRKSIDLLVETWLRRGYRQLGGSILLGAHPAETLDTVDGAVAAAREIDAALPDGLGLAYACGARVYPETPLARWIADHRAEAAPDLYGEDDPRFVRVVVFSRPLAPRPLLARVQAGLAGAKGNMAPMNAEVPATRAAEEAEALVNRGILRGFEGRHAEARDALEGALLRVPAHQEALRQLALLQANALGDPAGARATLTRLLAALPAGDPRREEVLSALEAVRATIPSP